MNIRGQRKTGVIATIVFFSIIILVYLLGASELSGFFVFRDMLFSMDWLNILFLMSLYALIAGIPAVILYVKFGNVQKWIAFAATIISVLCCVIIILNVETLLNVNEWISTFAQFALISSVPVLYCIAFFGRREVWVAFVPALMYFISFFMRYTIIYGFAETLKLFHYFDLEFIFYQDPDPSILIFMVKLILMNIVFIIWALLCIFISRMIYKFSNRQMTEC